MDVRQGLSHTESVESTAALSTEQASRRNAWNLLKTSKNRSSMKAFSRFTANDDDNEKAAKAAIKATLATLKTVEPEITNTIRALVELRAANSRGVGGPSSPLVSSLRPPCGLLSLTIPTDFLLHLHAIPWELCTVGPSG